MVEQLIAITEQVALGIEVIATITVVTGALATVWHLIGRRFGADHKTRKQIWRNFGMWLLLGLEFQLAADIVHTAIAPSWSQIGQLAAIAAIRTFLNYFLEQDLRRSSEPESGRQLVSSTYQPGRHRPERMRGEAL